MSSRHKQNRNRSRPQNSSAIPNVYPPIPGYSMPTPQWLPPHPGTNYPHQWYQPWANMPPLNNQNVTWLPPTTSVANTSDFPSPKSGVPTENPDEYTVDALRRIYNNDDGSIEIQRVKLQRKPGNGTKQNCIDYHSGSQSLVPVSPDILNERRPPPRKHKRKETQVNVDMEKKQDGLPPQGWYPYMSYLPQPFPYPYPYGYVWPMPPPPPSTVTVPARCQSPTDDSDCSISRQETFPVSAESPDKSRSPELQRPSSSAATSHVTESLGTDIAPSDSVSMRGFKRETSLERILRTSLSGSKQSDRPASDDMEKTKEWMEDMQKAFESKSGQPSDIAGDRSSFATAPSDIPTPPTRTKTKRESDSHKKITRRKSNSESNIDNPDEQRSSVSLPLFESTRVSDSDLIYAFKKLEHASGVFKAHASSGLSKNEHLEGDIRRRKTSREDGRCSRTSTLSFHSTRQSADENPVDTDSTDIAIPNDSSTADESIENFDESRAIDDIREDNYKWVLQQTGDISDNLQGHEEKPTDNLIENWRTEVSLWRARLVVSLCRGQGLDQQDWATFQLLVQHPLPMNLKLSLLHAHRICSQNYDVGVSMLRNALLHLTTFGETLMKPESERPSGWRTIAIEADQPWAPVKGSLEILRVLGFYVREDGALKYKRKQSPEISVIARLTLDLLVLAEEFRLFLTGAHQYPMNITQLFTPRDSHGDMHIAAIHQSEQHPNTHHNSVVVEQEDGRDAGSAIDRSDVEVVFEAPEQKLSDEKDIGKRGSKNAKRRPTPLPPSEALLHFSSTSLGEVDTLHSASENFSPQPSDTLSSSTSLPDLQSPSQASCLKLDSHKKESGSRETLTSTPTLEISEDKTLEQSNAEEGEKSIVEDKDQNESKSKRLSRRINGKDNPEDHIYEEIGDIKTQVEDLRERDSVSQSPPPLPPKTKSSTQNQEIYPNTEWSVSSQYSSVHSGSGVRKKKRKAPMPPELFTSDENETGKDVTMINENINNAFDSPIIEKDKRESEKPSHGNPFYEEKIKPAGYVGKNPFYEDLNKNISKKQTTESKTSKVDQQKEKVVPSVTFSRTSNEDVSEISESFSLPAGVRPQRRKDKGSTLKKTQNDSIKRIQNEIISVSNDDKSSENGSSASVITLKHVDSELPQEPLKTQDKPRPHATKPHEQKPHTKNDTGDHQCDPQVVVPIRNTETEGRKEVKDKISNKKDIILQKISITYDITIDDSDLPRDEVSDPSATEQNDVSKGTTPETSENKGTETSLVADEVGNDSSTVPKDSALNKATELPPVPPPKAALRLLDDIPYIDTNDVKSYKNSYTLFDRKQPPHYGLSEIRPQEVTNFSVSTAEEKVSTFLKRSSLVPFIDESDVPPDSPPPPPPLPPPSTPPLFLPIPLPLPPSTPPHLPPTPPPFPPPTPPPLPPPTPPFALHPSPPVDRLLPSIQVSLANQSSPLGGKDETQTLSEKSGESDIGSKISSTSDEKTTKEDVKTPEVSPELNASDMDYHSEHKDMILFETEVRLRTPDPYTAASEADRYEIPEPPKTEADVEERYEIPDVTRASASANASSHAKISETKEIFAKRREVEAAKKSKEGCLPKRPPRHQLSLKAPPRPPKPNEIDVPPKLPPKTSSLKSSTSPSVSPGHTTSLPSTLVKAYSSDRSSNKKVSPLSPVSSPSHTSARGPVSRSKSNTPKASSLSSIPTGIGINKGTEPSSPSIPHSTFKTLPRATYPPNKSVSMPSSPKVLKYPSKAPKQEEKKQKSWPFLLCDCVYATSSNEDVKYVVK